MRTRCLLTLFATASLAACGVHDDADHHNDQYEGTAEAESWAVTAWGDQFGLFP